MSHFGSFMSHFGSFFGSLLSFTQRGLSSREPGPTQARLFGYMISAVGVPASSHGGVSSRAFQDFIPPLNINQIMTPK